MNNRRLHPYVNGTAALEISHERVRSESRIIRVDFEGCEKSATMSEGFTNKNRSRLASLPAHADCARGRMRAGRDFSIAIDALGLKEVKEELVRGSISGTSLRKESPAVAMACGAFLFVFGMLVLIV